MVDSALHGFWVSGFAELDEFSSLVKDVPYDLTQPVRDWTRLPGRAYQAPIYPTLDVLWLERLPLGTPYPDVVARVREVVLHITGYMREKCCVVVDGTGVGAQLVDLLRAAKLGCEICALTITSGEHASQGSSSHLVGPNWNVPKQDLMAGLQVLLEAGELCGLHGS